MSSVSNFKMPDRKSCFCLLVTSMLFITGSHFFKSSASLFIGFLFMHAETPIRIAVMTILLVSTTVYLRCSKIFYPKVKSLFREHREHLGVSIAFSSCFYAIRSFYLSFHNFQGSLATLYTAFAFMVLSIAILYGNTGIPSSTAVMHASHLSLILAFFGLAIMIMPNMMNSAFVVAFTAAFSLVVSVVLFMMNTLRSEIVFYQSSTLSEKVGSSVESPPTTPSVTEDPIAEEVFSDVSNVLDESIPRRPSHASLRNILLHDTFHTPKRISPKKKEPNNNVESVVNEVVDEIMNDLTEQAKSIDSCVNYLLSDKKSCKPPGECSESPSANQIFKHRKANVCHDCRSKYF